MIQYLYEFCAGTQVFSLYSEQGELKAPASLCTAAFSPKKNRGRAAIHRLGPRKWGNIVSQDISWVHKQAGSKKIVLLPCCANEETFAEEAKSETFLLLGKQILLPQQMLRVRANGENNVSSFVEAFTPVWLVLLVSCKQIGTFEQQQHALFTFPLRLQTFNLWYKFRDFT